MTVAVIVLSVLLGLAVMWAAMCCLAARSTFGHADRLADALVASEEKAEEFRACLDLYERLLAGDGIDQAREHMEQEALLRRLEREMGR